MVFPLSFRHRHVPSPIWLWDRLPDLELLLEGKRSHLQRGSMVFLYLGDVNLGCDPGCQWKKTVDGEQDHILLDGRSFVAVAVARHRHDNYSSVLVLGVGDDAMLGCSNHVGEILAVGVAVFH